MLEQVGSIGTGVCRCTMAVRGMCLVLLLLRGGVGTFQAWQTDGWWQMMAEVMPAALVVVRVQGSVVHRVQLGGGGCRGLMSPGTHVGCAGGVLDLPCHATALQLSHDGSQPVCTLWVGLH